MRPSQALLEVAESGLAGTHQACLPAASVNRRKLAKPSLSPVPSLNTNCPQRIRLQGVGASTA